MDFSKFLDDDFDVKDWVNGSFKLNKDETNEEVNNVIDDCCQQEVKNLSRTMGDIDAVYQESSLLSEQMNIIRQDIEKVNKNTSQSMQTLVELDRLKELMNTTSDALQEADNWTTLSADVEEVFDTKDITIIAEKLIGMQQSLTILVDVPDYSERCQYLETLKNRLETMASTQIVEAFNTQSSDAAQVYMRIFSQIQRESQLIKYYNICQKEKLLPIWKSTCDKYSDDTMVESLSEYYDILLSTFHTQVQWCKHIFPDSISVVCTVMTDVLTTIQPDISTGIQIYTQANKSLGELCLLTSLINMKQISERFVKSMKKAVSGYGHHEKGGADVLHKLGVAVYTPYKPYISQYEEYEIAILMDILQQIPQHREDPTDNSELLNSSVGKLFEAADQAYERCIQFTNGAALDGLLKCLQRYFEQHITQYKEIIKGMKSKRHGEQVTVDTLDWTWFQYALKIIETAGDLILRAEELDQALVTNIVKYLGKLTSQSSTSLDYKTAFTMPLVDDFPALLLVEDRTIQHLILLADELKTGDQASVLDSVNTQLHQLSELSHKFAFDIVFAPLKTQLEDIATMEVWTQLSTGGVITTNLPTYSITPQEYITKIGQYLMTLPQQLEPFSTEDNPSLIAAMRWGKLPYINQQDHLEQISDMWLESVAQGTMHHYMEKVLHIPTLSPHATKQLITDIEYFSNVLEDLGFPPSNNLTDISSLLKATDSEFKEICSDKPQRLISAVKIMRGLKTTL